MKYKLLKIAYPFGLLILISGLFLVVLKENVVKYFINKNIQLTPGKFLYSSWVNVSIDLYTEFYLFDLTNSEEFEKNGAEPVFQERGPFVYKEIRTKEDIVRNCNGTVTYKERRRFFFLPEKSAYPEDYKITSINMGAMAIINFVRFRPGYELDIVNLALKLSGESLLVTQPANKLLFGYEDPFLKILSKLDKHLFPSDMIGLYYNKNGTIDGEYTIFDGTADPQKIGVINYFNGINKLDIWSTPFANQIHGTDGSLNFPLMNETSKPNFFQSDACRSINLVYNESIPSRDNIRLSGYILDEYLFANTSVNPSNEGFCTPPGNCLVSGVFNLSSCVLIGPASIPVYMSMPHFLFGDASLTNDIKGLRPDFLRHRTIMYFEPMTGIPMQANKRVQLNTKLIRNPNIDITKNLSEIYFPLFWIDENFAIDQKSADLFYNKVSFPLKIYDFLKYFVLVDGLLALFACVGITFYLILRNDPKVDNNENQANVMSTEDENEPNESSPLIIE